MNRSFLTIIFCALIISVYCREAAGENIVLKSGKEIEGRILERTDEYIRVDYNGTPLYYYLDNISSIDGRQIIQPSRKTVVPATSREDTGVLDDQIKEMKSALEEKDRQIEELKAQVKESGRLKNDLEVLHQAFRKLQAKYYNNLGGSFLYEKEFDRAAEAFAASLDLDPWNPEACFNLALIYENYLKDLKSAIAYYERYLSILPDAPDRAQVEAHIAKLKQ